MARHRARAAHGDLFAAIFVALVAAMLLVLVLHFAFDWLWPVASVASGMLAGGAVAINDSDRWW